ncbi:MAG: hypothetical protein WD314_15525 [Trueperaceae bacterium]
MTRNSTASKDALVERSASNARRVREFHDAIGERAPDSPTFPGKDLLALRRKLIEEENAEVMEALDGLADASGASDEERESRLAAAAHELADLLYVTYGALVWFGIDADEVFAAVHSANMRKATGPKRADGKQLKPPGWQPADVAGVVAGLRRDPRTED